MHINHIQTLNVKRLYIQWYQNNGIIINVYKININIELIIMRENIIDIGYYGFKLFYIFVHKIFNFIQSIYHKYLLCYGLTINKINK